MVVIKINIVIYDDDIDFIESTQNIINELRIHSNRNWYEPQCFTKADATLVFAEKNHNRPAIYLLDIVANGAIVGFDLAKQIKEINPDNLIVYISDYVDKLVFGEMTYKMLALGFIVKGSERFVADLEVTLQSACNILHSCYFINFDDQVIRIKVDDILYFHKKKETNYVHLVHKYGTHIFRDSLSNIKTRLDKRFCYSTRDYIVNTKAVVRVDRRENLLYFDNKKTCPISNSRKKELLSRFF